MLIPVFRWQALRDFPLLTVSLAAVNCLAYVVTDHCCPEARAAIAFRTPESGWFVWYLFRDLSVWPRLVSYTLVHGSIAHLALNNWMLLYFGSWVESTIGAVRTGILYFGGAVGAVLVHVQIVSNPNQILLGSSGAIAALMAFSCMQRPADWMVTAWWFGWSAIPIPIPAGLFFVYILFMQLVAAWSPTQDANVICFWGHIGGSIAGMIGLWIITAQRESRQVE